jgi:hypothetical protein
MRWAVLWFSARARKTAPEAGRAPRRERGRPWGLAIWYESGALGVVFFRGDAEKDTRERCSLRNAFASATFWFWCDALGGALVFREGAENSARGGTRSPKKCAPRKERAPELLWRWNDAIITLAARQLGRVRTHRIGHDAPWTRHRRSAFQPALAPGEGGLIWRC